MKSVNTTLKPNQLFLKCDNNLKHAWTGAPVHKLCEFNIKNTKLPIKNICLKRNVSKHRFDVLNGDKYFNSIDRRNFERCKKGGCGLVAVASDDRSRNQRLVRKAYKFTKKDGGIHHDTLHCLLEENDKDHKGCTLVQFRGKDQFDKMVNQIPIGSELFVYEDYGPEDSRTSHIFRLITHKEDDGTRGVYYSTNRPGKQKYVRYKKKDYFRNRPDYEFEVAIKLKGEEYKCGGGHVSIEKDKTVPVQKSFLEPNHWYNGTEVKEVPIGSKDYPIDLTRDKSIAPALGKRVPSDRLIRERKYRQDTDDNEQFQFELYQE